MERTEDKKRCQRELKPCPFCGSPAVTSTYYIECADIAGKCSVSPRIDLHDYRFDLDAAVGAWNTRHESSTLRSPTQRLDASEDVDLDMDSSPAVIFESGRQEANKEWREKLHTDGGKELIRLLLRHYTTEYLLEVIRCPTLQPAAREG